MSMAQPGPNACTYSNVGAFADLPFNQRRRALLSDDWQAKMRPVYGEYTIIPNDSSSRITKPDFVEIMVAKVKTSKPLLCIPYVLPQDL